ncbi:SDR family NAD(P)-dependent oxidoreductase [Rhizobium sp. S95]|uniref:SDR family NAD(P)-dependent oxidoreductase n=1 Tax=Ciceribacter sichuanensis TaxID=2949647 RepID=A0AAJ1BV87_9HYPH|nr:MULTISPECIES: SDR family NAD(P)-dependent oxidoreductase [unclassified Ciceribacter]MCM2395318.1 SDR family NAD(P)-dependent oxidoreductase [Ciceribacter sp. S95]MCO5955740.1 SDR family NAD(P)-dependent oxidoreductase [Ciceribacter sp. S101]
MEKTILITGASSGFGAMTARSLAHAGHRVYASMRDLKAHGGAPVAEIEALARSEGLNLMPIELDVTSASSAESAVARIIRETGRLDVLIHNAGHMGFGPAEAFSPEQLVQLYDVNVVGAHRLNRAALPFMRKSGGGLIVWIGSSSTRGGTPPFLAPYFAAKAAMDALAQSYALELARFDIETTILVPGAFTKGTQHFAHAMQPADAERSAVYWQGPYAGADEAALQGLASLEPAEADPSAVARAVADVVAMPHGKRPFRVHVDPSEDGAEIVNGVADRVRAQLLERIGLKDLLHPTRA